MKKLVIGIVGGIGSGKTEVSKLFVRRGGWLFQADSCGHQLLENEKTKQKIVSKFGPSILDAEGTISRKVLGELVFSKAEMREALEEILHPEIRKKAVESINLGQQSSDHSFIVLDIPLLLEKDWRDLCDKLVFIDCKDELRQQRVKGRGWSDELWKIREKTQMPLTPKAQLCDYTIINSADLNETFQQVCDLVDKLNLP